MTERNDKYRVVPFRLFEGALILIVLKIAGRPHDQPSQSAEDVRALMYSSLLSHVIVDRNRHT